MNRESLRTALAVSLIALASACGRWNPIPLPPAAYKAPEVGTVLRYRDLNYTVSSVDGWRMSTRDDSGRVGRYMGMFISDTPENPITLDTTKLAELWPLSAGKKVTIPMSQGNGRWEWRMVVTGQQVVDVPAGSFKTFLVECIQIPVGMGIGNAPTRMYSWNYAPSIKAIVRFDVAILAGPNRGKRGGSMLQSIVDSATAANEK